MKPEDPILRRIGNRLGGLPAAILSLTILGIFLCVAAITFLAEEVRREVDVLAVANTDSMQWSLGQTEVDILLLQSAVHQTLAKETASLSEVRTRFDVLYSRVQLIGESKQFAELRTFPDAQTSLATLNAFLAKHTPSFDGPDDVLLANLPELERDTESLRAAGREFALLGVRLHVADSDTRRQSLVTTLTRIGYLTALLVFALLGGIGILFAMFGRLIRSEAAAGDARNWLQRVIASSLDGIIAADQSGRIIEYNGAAERLFGYSRSEAMGQDLAEVIIPHHLRAAHHTGMERYWKTGDAHVVGKGLVRLEALRKSGEVFPVELSLSSAVLDGREVFVAFLRDISDRVADERELIEARDKALAGERAKADLLAVMSHEMRTPLNGILGTIQLMQGTFLSTKQDRFIAAMKTSAELLLHHVNGVLGMSRAEAKQLELDIVEIDPGALIKDLVESQRHAIEANGNRIKFNATYAPVQIWADPLRLRQVILNLIGNANKFTRNGEITVECDTIPGGAQVEFRVIDTGIGIADENRERIFEEFRILDTSYSRKTEGTGLGLSISRKLVQAMGGEIGVESELGEGSLFWVRLPIGAPEGQHHQAPNRKPSGRSRRKTASARKLRVLLVEDNQINRLVAGEMLQKAGHSVVEAHDGREAVRLAGSMPFDLILMDISMPEVDGVTATVLIRDGEGPNRQTPIFAVTAFALPQDADRFHEAGITKTLIKPFTEDDLRQALASVANPDLEMTPDQPYQLQLAYRDLSDRLGRDKAAGLYDRFRGEGNDLMARVLSETWTSEPATLRADAVHKVAGSAALLGASCFRKMLLMLERDYRSGQVEAADRNIDHLKTCWDQALEEIARLTKP